MDSFVACQRPSLASWCRGLGAVLLPLAAVAAQCQLAWQPFSPLAGANHRVTTLVASPDGALFAGGWFEAVGTTRARKVARWDGAAWHALGSGIDGTVMASTLLPSGDLVVGGVFTAAGGVPVANIARWDGQAWHAIGSGFDGAVSALAVLPNGDLLAGGAFLASGGQSIDRVARWNGTAWTQLGSGIGNGQVLAIEPMPAGAVAIGGTFSLAGGGTHLGATIWDGSGFVQLGNTTVSPIYALQALPNGQLALGGSSLAPAKLLLWNGSVLTPEPQPVQGTIFALELDAAGDLVVGGSDAGGNTFGPLVSRRTASGWTTLHSGSEQVFALALRGNAVVAGSGAFAGEARRPTIIAYDGATWAPLGGPANAEVRHLASLPNGDVIAAGTFDAIQGVPAANVARWDGSTWWPLGLGVNATVAHLAAGPDGRVVVVGNFSSVGGQPAAGLPFGIVAAWDGSAWQVLGGGPGFVPLDVAVAPNGDVVAIGGIGSVSVFRAGAWSALPGLLPFGITGQRCTVALDGDILVAASVGGAFRFDGQTWHALPGAPVGPTSIAVAADGAPWVSGSFAGVGFVAARWNGAGWQQQGGALSAVPRELVPLPTGEMLLTGFFDTIGGVPVGGLGRWDGAWQAVDGGLGLSMGAAFQVSAAAWSGRGQLMVAGSFATAGPLVSGRLALAVTNCPATVGSSGAGCVGGSALSLSTPDVPWLGSAVRLLASGLSPTALALQVTGTAGAALPLPFAPLGCTLLVQPILLEPTLPVNGATTTSLAVPAQPALVGQSLRTQTLGLDFGGGGLTQIAVSNVLALVLGDF